MSEEEERDYRRALGGFATGVAIVTAGDAARGFSAITINSLTSVSLTPRLILWCLGDKSDRYAAFAEAESFGVTILEAGQHDLAARFAVQGASAISAQELTLKGAIPVLEQGLVRLACHTHERRVMGDHLVIVGEVLSYESGGGDGLSYFRGRFGRIPAP